MSRFWSPFVRDLVPYVPGEQPKDKVFIKLNTNENPYGPSPHALEVIRDAAGDDLRRYPDPMATDLRAAISEGLGLTEDHVFIGNGSDEVLAHAFNGFFRDKGPVLFPDVTYSFYPTYCRLFELASHHVPLDEDFRLDPEDYRGSCGGIVIANPNAPTGIAIGLDEIAHVLSRNPDRVVLVDEAYVDFGSESAVSLVPEHDNLLVVQTFSKSRSLAGMRVGFAVGQPHLIEGLLRVKDSFNSYPLDQLALAGAKAAWHDRNWFEETRKLVMTDRDATADALSGQGFRVLPSKTNFLFASHPDISGAALLEALRNEGILVRHFRGTRTGNWLRISVGTKEECGRLVEATGSILSRATA
ncbi:histidinol-phosphate transaminase [uncultured Roseibium sp.]|uniref:histidinol-phosphate transaminase n=1 Tax=uncultured Roseibium sp. TaxID=1936171 RepID=UPI00321797A9